jgi:hypothetical protein
LHAPVVLSRSTTSLNAHCTVHGAVAPGGPLNPLAQAVHLSLPVFDHVLTGQMVHSFALVAPREEPTVPATHKPPQRGCAGRSFHVPTGQSRHVVADAAGWYAPFAHGSSGVPPGQKWPCVQVVQTAAPALEKSPGRQGIFVAFDTPGGQ